MVRYGVRVLPRRDHQLGWAHPYARPSSNNGKGGGKSSSNKSGKGAAYRPSFPSREQEMANRRVQQLRVSKWERSPTPGDTSGDEEEDAAEEPIKIQGIKENQYQFLDSVFRRHTRGESQEWLQRHVAGGSDTKATSSPSPLWGRPSPKIPTSQLQKLKNTGHYLRRYIACLTGRTRWT